MSDLANLQPFLIGFLVLAGVVSVVALASIARVVADLRQGRSATPVVSIAGRTSAVAAGRAA